MKYKLITVYGFQINFQFQVNNHSKGTADGTDAPLDLGMAVAPAGMDQILIFFDKSQHFRSEIPLFTPDFQNSKIWAISPTLLLTLLGMKQLENVF